MKLPEIDIDELPGLETKTGVYGSITGGGKSDDGAIAVMVYLYTTASAEGLSEI